MNLLGQIFGLFAGGGSPSLIVRAAEPNTPPRALTGKQSPFPGLLARADQRSSSSVDDNAIVELLIKIPDFKRRVDVLCENDLKRFPKRDDGYRIVGDSEHWTAVMTLTQYCETKVGVDGYPIKVSVRDVSTALEKLKIVHNPKAVA